MLRIYTCFLTTTLLVCVVSVSRGQKIFFLDARWELEISGGHSLPIGPKESEGNVTLLPNMNSGPSYNFRLMRYLRKNVSIGGWVGVTQFDNWRNPSSSLYDGTSAKFLAAGPSIMYKAWPSRRKVNLSLLLSPGISRVDIRTSPNSENNGTSITVPLSVNSLRFTMAANASMQYLISDSFGFLLSIGYQRTFANSKIFPDKNFDFLSAEAGFQLRLSKNKRYKYREL